MHEDRALNRNPHYPPGMDMRQVRDDPSISVARAMQWGMSIASRTRQEADERRDELQANEGDEGSD